MTDIIHKRTCFRLGMLLTAMPVMQALNLFFVSDEMSRKVLSDLFQALAALLAAGALTLAARKLNREQSLSAPGWTVISIAAGLYAVGMVSFMFVEVVLKQAPYPGFPDVFFLCFYPVMIIGLALLPRERLTGREKRNAILDLGAFGLVAAMIVWHLNLRLLIQSLATHPTAGVLVSLCYTIADTLLLLMLFSILVQKLGTGRQFVPMLFLVIGGFFLIAADLLQGYVSTYTNFASGSPMDMGWVLFSTLSGRAALYHLNDNVSTHGADGHADLSITIWAIAITYVWIVLVFAMLVWAVFNSEHVHPGLLITGVVGATLLAITRQIRTTRENVALYARLQEALGELELKVQERTTELLQAKEEAEILAGERGKILASLQASREEQRLIARNISDLIWSMDMSYRFTYANPAVERIHGWTVKEFQALSIQDVLPPESLAAAMAVLTEEISRNEAPNADHSRPRTLELALMRKDGSTFLGEISASLLCQDDGSPTLIIGSTRDITERRALEQQVIQQQKLEGIGMLAGGVAHDINNLLTPIYFSVEMAEKAIGPEHPVQTRLQTIQNSATKIRDLVRQLLIFSRKQQTHLAKLDLNEVVSGFMKILRRTIRENIIIEQRLDTTPYPVKADRTQLEQIIMNLAVNAQDSIEGTGKITIETGRIFLDSEFCSCHPGTTPGNYVMLAFSDSGCGMDEETRGKVFEPFFTTKPVGKGTGLGLSTVFGIIQLHGGIIDVLSRPGLGSTFRVFLPIVQDSAETVTSTPSVVNPVVSFTGTLLLVEDNDMLRESLCEALKESDFHVLVAASPHEAIAVFMEHRDDIRLLLTDIVMPEMNGPELYHAFRELKADLSVLFMSGYASDIDKYQEIVENPDIFLTKPFTIQALLSKLSKFISQHAQSLENETSGSIISRFS
ncbi:MAG: ATP-binding protein [Geobacteraceae bacterium]|nr:ATP-binding protein [Geobacteraceae bacterium]